MIVMKKHLILLAAAVLASFGASIFLGACEIVEDDSPDPETEVFASLDEFYAEREVKPIVYKADAALGGSFTTDKGSVIKIPENAFTTKDGRSVSGPIDIEVKEVFSTLDIINSGVFPISNDAVLNSGGEFFIEASSNGEELVVGKDAFISFSIPAQAVDANMQLFFGGPGNDNEDVNWEPLDTIGVDTLRGDTARVFRSNSSFTFNSADNSYQIELDSMGWGNIDAFLNTQYFDCTFNLKGVDDLDGANTTAFAVFKDQNSIWPVGANSWGSINNNLITERHLADVAMNVVVISVVNKQLYYGLLDITPAPNTTYDIEMKMIESDDLDDIISNLP